MRRGKYDSIRATSKLTLNSPLRPEELQVLRAQYEKEGEFVGVQTKFNYAWVSRRIISTIVFHVLCD
jgi:hypothetical protein